jgi:hypothetical protein
MRGRRQANEGFIVQDTVGKCVSIILVADTAESRPKLADFRLKFRRQFQPGDVRPGDVPGKPPGPSHPIDATRSGKKSSSVRDFQQKSGNRPLRTSPRRSYTQRRFGWDK